jgi:AsmA protein
MRGWGLVAGAVVAAAITVSLGSVAWPVNPGHAAQDFAFALGAIGSPVVEAPSAASLTLLPRPTLHFAKLDMRAAGGAFALRAAGGEAVLRVDRLLLGQFAASELSLRGADIDVDLDAAAGVLARLTRPPVQRVTLQGGALTLASARLGWQSRFEVVSARLDWPTPGSAMQLSATGKWREQPVEASAEIGAPLPAANGAPSSLRLAIDAPPARLRFSGDLSVAGRLEGGRAYLGQVSARIPSLPEFSTWIGRPSRASPTSLGLEATASGDAHTLRLADARIVVAGQSFEGGLDLGRTEAGVSASGTLAADRLDLGPLLGPPPVIFEEGGAWSKAAALPAASRRVDLDLRISATRAVWGGYALDNAAAAVSQRAGLLTVKLLEASVGHGALSGEISVEDRPEGCASRLALNLENADFGAGLADLGAPNFSGHGTLKASLRARGRSPAEIVASADGTGSIEIVDGALLNLNFEEALRRGQRRPIDPARDMNAGPTRFDAASGRFEIGGGEARFVDATTRAPGVSLLLTGAIDLKNRAWRAGIEARQSAPDGAPSLEGAHIDFTLAGPWDAPTLAPVLPPAD